MSFLTSRYVFKKVQGQKLIVLSVSLSCLGPTLFAIIVEASSWVRLKQVAGVLLTVSSGYWCGVFQGKISGLTSNAGPFSISLMNGGTGVAGVSSNLIAISLNLLFPTTNSDTKFKAYTQQIAVYLVLLNAILGLYLWMLCKFLKQFEKLVRSLDHSSLQDSHELKRLSNKSFLVNSSLVKKEPEYSLRGMMTRVLDLYIGIVFNYSFSLQIISFIIPTLAAKYDDNNQMLLICYYLTFNLMDAVGKLIPVRYFLKTSKILHILSVCRVSLQVYFSFLLLTSPPVFLSHYLTRMFVYFWIAIFDGFFTNNYFSFASNRFKCHTNKDKKLKI